MKISEFLAEARDELAVGWTKNTLRNQANEVCGLGALRRVAFHHLADGGPQIYNAARSALSEKTQEIYGNPSIPRVNDMISIKHQDMLNLFDKCIIGLEEHGE